MDNHKEKLAIFDKYAKEKGYKSWTDLLINFKTCEFSVRVFNKHLMNSTDLVQKEALKKASENAELKEELKFNKAPGLRRSGGTWMERSVDKQSVLSEENLVK